MIEPIRAECCSGCPFRDGMTGVEIAKASEGGPYSMLCHESGCLDGNGPDLRCRGFAESLAMVDALSTL